MKIILNFSLALLVFANSSLLAQSKQTFPYDTVAGDPTQTRIYTLPNGLKVYLSVYKNSPRVYTSIAVKTGSKNDPADATGLAHYLEHMLFKGTDQYGTLNYGKEQIELRKIDSLYSVYGQSNDTLKRKKIYHLIDSVSYVASKLAIANEDEFDGCNRNQCLYMGGPNGLRKRCAG
jgi:predicted Zn-dependent peptidase